MITRRTLSLYDTLLLVSIWRRTERVRWSAGSSTLLDDLVIDLFSGNNLLDRLNFKLLRVHEVTSVHPLPRVAAKVILEAFGPQSLPIHRCDFETSGLDTAC